MRNEKETRSASQIVVRASISRTENAGETHPSFSGGKSGEREGEGERNIRDRDSRRGVYLSFPFGNKNDASK